MVEFKEYRHAAVYKYFINNALFHLDIVDITAVIIKDIACDIWRVHYAIWQT